MRSRPRLLRQLIDDSLYVVNERAVADALLARAMVRATVADPEFRAERGHAGVRSFRRQRGVRSFRLAASPSVRRLHTNVSSDPRRRRTGQPG